MGTSTGEGLLTDKVIEFVFTNKGNVAVALNIRGGIAEYISVPGDFIKKPDFVLKMDSEIWAELYLNSSNIEDEIKLGNVKVDGDTNELVTIFDMFDTFNPENNYKVPPVAN